ncbi:DUF2971 domain-containing protein [Hyphococcus sp.]|uniref:DUF2971 domain-containing protein n=1 Tax=Hyphococcus sp. TaxID=2038636 RepID=UPI003CCC144F
MTTDFNIDPKLLAAYAEAVGEIPHFPTTCFSSSPVVVPMWAHYAENHKGFVIELFENELTSYLHEARIDNVKYSDRPLTDFADLIARVVHIGKPRYTYLLTNAVLEAAYFTKTVCWSYEQERRLIAQNSFVRELNDLILLDLPPACLKSIVCGANASQETKGRLQDISKTMGCEYYELRIGKSSSVPFLVDSSGRSFTFTGTEISSSKSFCKECKEPLGSVQEKCSWCQIDDAMRANAASRNSYRILNHYGMLEEYIREMDSVTGSGRRDDAEGE